MNHPALERVAELIAERNALDAEIAAIAGRTALASHLGEWKRRRSGTALESARLLVGQ